MNPPPPRLREQCSRRGGDRERKGGEECYKLIPCRYVLLQSWTHNGCGYLHNTYIESSNQNSSVHRVDYLQVLSLTNEKLETGSCEGRKNHLLWGCAHWQVPHSSVNIPMLIYKWATLDLAGCKTWYEIGGICWREHEVCLRGRQKVDIIMLHYIQVGNFEK